MIDWNINGQEMANCNCNFGCPCQFGVLPTGGSCQAVAVFNITKGHYGDVSLDGLQAAAVYYWPSAIHEGDGQFQLIIGDTASAEQKAALEAIMTGKDTEEMATMWYVFNATSSTQHPTLSAPIELDWDIDSRVGQAKVGEIFDIAVAPIPNIVSGEPHRISIKLTDSFEFRQAEMASGTSNTHGGVIDLSFEATHAHIAKLNLTGQGVV
ncbi:MAG TPA: hypothetical protein DE179_09605 [Oceanospirillaceae bacterium]|nr:hypothetical protein [Oceanospirillaceae bacterium]